MQEQCGQATAGNALRSPCGYEAWAAGAWRDDVKRAHLSWLTNPESGVRASGFVQSSASPTFASTSIWPAVAFALKLPAAYETKPQLKGLPAVLPRSPSFAGQAQHTKPKDVDGCAFAGPS